MDIWDETLEAVSFLLLCVSLLNPLNPNACPTLMPNELKSNTFHQVIGDEAMCMWSELVIIVTASLYCAVTIISHAGY